MPHASSSTGRPERDVTQSRTTSAPASRAALAISSTGWQTPVDVSAWTNDTTFGFVVAIASDIAFASRVLPHSTSTVVTTAPARRATSAMRTPNTPLIPTTTVSPGSSRFTKAASMPALPVAEIGSVIAFTVPKQVRRPSLTRSSRAMNSGSRWPSSGRLIASRTAGCALEGPGPRSRRSGNGFRIDMAAD